MTLCRREFYFSEGKNFPVSCIVFNENISYIKKDEILNRKTAFFLKKKS